jgi:hypothetical protein
VTQFGLSQRHRKLAQRVLCAEKWETRLSKVEGHEHRCEVFRGHTAAHRCRCQSTKVKGER